MRHKKIVEKFPRKFAIQSQERSVQQCPSMNALSNLARSARQVSRRSVTIFQKSIVQLWRNKSVRRFLVRSVRVFQRLAVLQSRDISVRLLQCRPVTSVHHCQRVVTCVRMCSGAESAVMTTPGTQLSHLTITDNIACLMIVK